MKKIIYMILMVIFVQIIWGVESPRIIQPAEDSIINKNDLFIFIEPTPQDIENNIYIDIEIYNRNSGKLIDKRSISSSNNYKENINIINWENGRYLMKAVYTDKEGNHLTKATWCNFNIKK